MMRLSLKVNEVNGVPFNEYYLENQEYKGLVFIQHGYTSNKDYGTDYLAIPLAMSGYFVVSIDAYKHGARIEEPFTSKDEKKMLLEAPYVVRRTAIDIIKLHKQRYIRQFPKFDLIGISMGAMIAYYASTKTNNIKKLMPVIGTPNFVFQANHQLEVTGLNKDEFLNESTINYLKRISPINNVHKMKYEQLLILNGTEDHVVPIAPTIKLVEEYNINNFEYRTYKVGHEVHREMQIDIHNYILN